jgi:hypothetical protein
MIWDIKNRMRTVLRRMRKNKREGVFEQLHTKILKLTFSKFFLAFLWHYYKLLFCFVCVWHIWNYFENVIVIGPFMCFQPQSNLSSSPSIFLSLSLSPSLSLFLLKMFQITERSQKDLKKQKRKLAHLWKAIEKYFIVHLKALS